MIKKVKKIDFKSIKAKILRTKYRSITFLFIYLFLRIRKSTIPVTKELARQPVLIYLMPTICQVWDGYSIEHKKQKA